MSEKQKYIILPKVRLSYAHVFKPHVFAGGGESKPKHECTMLLPKDSSADLVEKVRKLCTSALLDKYGTKDKIPAVFMKMVKKELFGQHDKCFLRDGDDSGQDAHEGHYTVKAANATKPSTFDVNRTPIDEDSGLLYSGCYADVRITVWIMDNQYGKRICANLDGLRFREHGDPLGGGGSKASADDFDEVEDLDDEDDGLGDMDDDI